MKHKCKFKGCSNPTEKENSYCKYHQAKKVEDNKAAANLIMLATAGIFIIKKGIKKFL